MMNLISALTALRRSLMIIAGAWLVAFILLFGRAEELFGWLASPLQQVLPQGGSLVFLSATEPFFTFLQLAAVAGLVAALPVISWQGWSLLASARPNMGRWLGLGFVAGSSSAFLLGAGLGFRYLFPLIIAVLVRFGTEAGGIAALLSMGDYLSLALHMLLAFGLICELPVLMIVLTRLGLTTHRWYAAQRKYMLIGAFIFGALITPGPDVISQSSIAIPFLLLYEVGIIGARWVAPPKAAAG